MSSPMRTPVPSMNATRSGRSAWLARSSSARLLRSRMTSAAATRVAKADEKSSCQRAVVASTCHAYNQCDGWLLNAGRGGESEISAPMRIGVM